MMRSLLDDARYANIGRGKHTDPGRGRAERGKLALAAGLLVVAIGMLGCYYGLIPDLSSGPPPVVPSEADQAEIAKQNAARDELIKSGRAFIGGS
jgi:hypothetical protein